MPQQPTHPAILDFLDDMRTLTGATKTRPRWAPSTVQRNTSNYCRFERWLAARGVDPLKATDRDLQAYIDERAGEVGASALAKTWQNLDDFYGWASRPHPTTRKDRPGANLLDRNPMLRVPAPVVPDRLPNRRYAQADDVNALLTYYDRLAVRLTPRNGKSPSGEFVRAKRNGALLALVAGSGMRIGEVPFIDLHHLIKDGDNFVGVLVGGDDGSHTKSSKGRTVAVSDQANLYLKRYLRYRGSEPGPLFIGRERHTTDPEGRMTARAMQEVVKRATRRVGVQLSPHDLRREWTATQHRNGASADDIMLVGGWSKKETMLTYAGPAAEIAAVRRLRAVAS